MSSFVVIGGGLLGAATAHRLSSAGADVTIVEAAEPGSGTSGRTFAWLNAQEKSPAHYFDLNRAGMRAYAAIRDELGDDSWYHPGGDLAIGVGPAAAGAADRAARHEALGYAVRTVDPGELEDLEPNIRLDTALDHAIFLYPEEAWVEADVLARRLVDAAVGLGARLLTGDAVVAFDRSPQRIEGVRLRSGARLTADQVLLAAGPDSERIAALAGVRLPTSPTPGLLAITTPTAATVGRVIHAGQLSLRPEPGGRIMLASRSIDGQLDREASTVALDGPECSALLDLARRLLPGLADTRIGEVRIGRRSVAEDGLPVAGPAPDVAGLYLLVSHSGVTLTPLLGRLVAGELLDGANELLEPYRPDRFA